MKPAMGYSEYQALMSDFVNLVQQRLGDQVVSVVLYGSVARGAARAESEDIRENAEAYVHYREKY
jgi:predicted nucleotidyltransferase